MKRPVDKTKSKKAILPPKAEKVIVEEEKKPVEAQKEDKSAKKANWKAQHENFIENIRFNRKLKDVRIYHNTSFLSLNRWRPKVKTLKA